MRNIQVTALLISQNSDGSQKYEGTATLDTSYIEDTYEITFVDE